MTNRVYHFCAECHTVPGRIQVSHGLLHIQGDPFASDAYNSIVAQIASNMDPPRPAKQIVVRSLSLIAEKP
jgi:hypothetical protein